MEDLRRLNIVDDDGLFKGSLKDYAKQHGLKISKKHGAEELILTLDDMNKPNIGRVIYSYLKKINEINQYNFVKLNGVYVSHELFKIGVQEGFSNEICKLITLCSIRNRIKKTSTSECKSWTELYQSIEIKNRNRAAQFRKVLMKYDMVRLETFKNTKLGERKQIILNPNYFRHGSHVSQACIVAFRDLTLNKIHKYNVFYLYINGLIDIEDIQKNVPHLIRDKNTHESIKSELDSK